MYCDYTVVTIEFRKVIFPSMTFIQLRGSVTAGVGREQLLCLKTAFVRGKRYRVLLLIIVAQLPSPWKFDTSSMYMLRVRYRCVKRFFCFFVIYLPKNLGQSLKLLEKKKKPSWRYFIRRTSLAATFFILRVRLFLFSAYDVFIRRPS